MTYFTRLPYLNVKNYTNYFLHTFMPKNNFDEKHKSLFYIQYFRKEFYKDSTIMLLDLTLQKKYNFPPIEYFNIFKHERQQTIHHDGIEIPRYASLNLPLQGFELTKMIFYKKLVESPLNISNANYYLPENVEPVSELAGSNEWVLVNSSVPHNITNVDFNNPRITLCIRFISNPTYDFLVKNLTDNNIKM